MGSCEKSAYEATATGTSSAGSRHGSSSCSSPVGGSPAPKEELNISLHQLREEYCRSVLEGDSRSNTPTKAPPETGVSIRQLTRSMTDLTTVGQDTHTSIKDDDRSVLATVNVKALTRSFTDLTRLSEPVMPPNRMTRPRYDTAPASVSVKPLQVSQMPTECKQCGKQVFQMERIVAERAAWHKNCFRCTECNTILTLETYQSHEGVLYCKPHFRDLFRPKAVVEDPMEARKDRTTDRPDYGLEELSTANVRQKFAMFEQAAQEDELQADPAQIRRSNSLLNRAARFMYGEDDDYGIENSELGDYEEDEEDEDEDQEEAGEGEEGEDGDPDAVKTKKKKKITRPVSFAGMEDLKRQRNRRDEMRKRRNQELSQFRQMLCAGKNISTREMFESGSLDGQNDKNKRPEQINIEGRPATKNLRERFEKGELGGSLDDQKEVDEVFRNSETASKARNLFKQMESGEGQENDERATAKPRENRLSKEGCDDEEVADFYGRDPNLVKYTDNLEEPLDCRKTKSVLAMFRKMEMQEDDDAKGPRPLKRFTPPPEGEYDDSDDEEYSDEEYSDEEDEEDDDEDEEEESDDDDERPRKPKYKDEILEMAKSSQSARKAASLRAKFERWESEVEHNNEYNRNERNEDDEECMPSIDTARNLRAMFENKAQEASRPVVSSQPKLKVNRFVGGGGDKCLSCDRTVYAMERLEVAGRVLHKNCFKCCKCSTKLSMNSFSIGGEDIYCMTHYKQAFTEKGTYDVFTPNKGKWTRKIEATSSELAKSQE